MTYVESIVAGTIQLSTEISPNYDRTQRWFSIVLGGRVYFIIIKLG